MIDPAYAVQKGLHARLTAAGVLTALVPATAIVDDFGGVPTVFPSIILGEAQVIDEGQRIDRSVHRVYSTWHLWTEEPHLNQVKKIGGAFREAVRGPRLELDGYHVADLRIDDIRYIRDPGGAHGHGVVTINALVGEIA